MYQIRLLDGPKRNEEERFRWREVWVEVRTTNINNNYNITVMKMDRIGEGVYKNERRKTRVRCLLH